MAADVSISTFRLVLRIANAFVLDLLNIYRGDRDFTDGLIIATLVQTKSARLAGDLELQRQHALFETPPPEEMRRAISINAIAASLGLPFETARRRANRLVAAGICETRVDGVQLSDQVLKSPAQRQALEDIYEVTKNLYIRLREVDCLGLMNLPPAATGPLAGPRPVRIVWRSASGYFLRTLEPLLPNFANLTQAFLMMEIIRANTERLSDTMRGADGFGANAMVPDAYRRAVSASEIASRLKLPPQTARRNIAALIADGRCQRTASGLVVPAAVLARLGISAAYAPNFQNLSRMFAQLAETGILRRWDAELGNQSSAIRAG